MDAIIKVNQGHAVAYGHDDSSKKAIDVISKKFKNVAGVVFVFTGTAANTLSLKLATKSHNSILVSEVKGASINQLKLIFKKE